MGTEPACQCRRHKRLGLGRSAGRRNGNLLQYARLENPMDRGAWWATGNGTEESDTTEATACTQEKTGEPMALLPTLQRNNGHPSESTVL